VSTTLLFEYPSASGPNPRLSLTEKLTAGLQLRMMLLIRLAYQFVVPVISTRTLFVAALALLLLSSIAVPSSFGQERPASGAITEEVSVPSDSVSTGPATHLGIGTVGVGLGDTRRTTGVRLAWRNGRFRRANGVNVTLWLPYNVNLDGVDEEEEFEESFVGTTNGLALGLLHYPERVRGVGVGAFGSVAESLQGLAVSGLVAAAIDDASGLLLGGAGAAAGESISGVAVGGLAAGAEESVNGIVVGGVGVSARNIRGVGLGGGTVQVENGTIHGIVASAYNDIEGRQVGLSIGIYNHASALRGVQLGLLNVARDNPGWARVLPILNLSL